MRVQVYNTSKNHRVDNHSGVEVLHQDQNITETQIPRHSMYAIYAYIDPPNHPNVGIYGIYMECLGLGFASPPCRPVWAVRTGHEDPVGRGKRAPGIRLKKSHW